LKLLGQVRQRKLLQWAVGYVAAGFALLQGVDIVAQQFDWPLQIPRTVTLSLVVGFFVALLLAWYHGERGTQRITVVELLLLATVIGVGTPLAWLFGQVTTSTPAAVIDTPVVQQEIHSIAVLPLDNYSGDPEQDYFAEGMTDQLTSDLAMISSLRVISRGSTTQFSDVDRPTTPEIAEFLNVDAVVEGSVQRFGNRVRITVQLIDARLDRHMWARSFDGDSKDVLMLQDQMASAIAHEINAHLNPREVSRFTQTKKVHPEAYDAYLKGRYFFNRPSDNNLTKSITQFEIAIDLDPRFAPAYSGLSDTYMWVGFNESVMSASEVRSRAKRAAERAVQLDNNLAEAHSSLAVYYTFYPYDWAEAEREFRRTFELNPNYAYAHDQFAMALAFQGRLDEALSESESAAELDPLSPLMVVDAYLPLTFQGKYDEAEKRLAGGEYIDPNFFFIPWSQGWVNLQLGDLGRAIPLLRRAVQLDAPAYTIAWLGYALGANGNHDQALATIDTLKQHFPDEAVPAFNLALIQLGLGKNDEALRQLEKAWSEDSQWLGYLKNDHVFDPLRPDNRFAALLRKAGFE